MKPLPYSTICFLIVTILLHCKWSPFPWLDFLVLYYYSALNHQSCLYLLCHFFVTGVNFTCFIWHCFKIPSGKVSHLNLIIAFIQLHEKLLQFNCLRTVGFQLNLKYLHAEVNYYFHADQNHETRSPGKFIYNGIKISRFSSGGDSRTQWKFRKPKH